MNPSPKPSAEAVAAAPFYLQDELDCLLTVDGVGKAEKRKCLAAIQARQLARLSAALARGKEDGERLDWLEDGNNLAIDHSFWAEHMPSAGKQIITLMEMDEDCCEPKDQISRGDSIRAAIDAARTQNLNPREKQ